MATVLVSFHMIMLLDFKSHLECRPFENRPLFHHWKVQISDPYFTSLLNLVASKPWLTFFLQSIWRRWSNCPSHLQISRQVWSESGRYRSLLRPWPKRHGRQTSRERHSKTQYRIRRFAEWCWPGDIGDTWSAALGKWRLCGTRFSMEKARQFHRSRWKGPTMNLDFEWH